MEATRLSDPDVNIRKRFRSPPYPYLSLAKSIERASQFHQKAQHHSVGLSVLADAWGLSVLSGGLLKSGAALIQYGLLVDQGSGDVRKFQLTEAARRILNDADPNSDRRKQLIKSAALLPTIHKELWEKFGTAVGLSDALLKNHLLFDRVEIGEAPYGDQAADEVIQNYREAIAFAGLDRVEPALEGSDRYEENSSATNTHALRVSKRSDEGVQSVLKFSPSLGSEWMRSALSAETVVRISVEGPMGPKEIGKLIKLLEVQRIILEDE